MVVLVVDHTGPETIDDLAQRAFTVCKPGRKDFADGPLFLLPENNPPPRKRERSNEPAWRCFPQVDTAHSIFRRMDDQTGRMGFTYR